MRPRAETDDSRSLLIGISGGHRKSCAICTTHSLDVLGAVEGEGLTFHGLRPDLVAGRLQKLLESLAVCLKSRLEDIESRTAYTCLSIAGAATEHDREGVIDCVQSLDWGCTECEILDDTWAGLVSGTGQFTGICAFAGTGASVYVERRDPERRGPQEYGSAKPNKIDGWGPIIGDFGSGFQLATDMLREIGRYYDRNLKPPPLFNELVARFRDVDEDIDRVQQWFDSLQMAAKDYDWRVIFAKIASVAVTAADRRAKPDPMAVDLVERSADQMIESLKIAMSRDGVLESVRAGILPIVFHGGMFENSRLYRDRVHQAFAAEGTRIGLSSLRPVCGAVLVAAWRVGTSTLHTLHERLAAKLNDVAENERRLLIYPVVQNSIRRRLEQLDG